MQNVMIVVLAALILSFGLKAFATPEEDRIAFTAYFMKKFPKTDPADFINGVYSIHPESREQWEEIEEFPPYEIAIDEGKSLFLKKFSNGKSYADCFDNGGKNVRKNYPYFDTKRGEVITLELAINDCRLSNNESALKYNKGDMANLSAYMAFSSRGEKINVSIPNKDALAAYEAGKEFYYRKRGQLNFSCMDCHVSSVGLNVRAEKLSPSLGHISHFPVYRSKWGGMGTLHRRFKGCNEQVRAKPESPQSEAYRNLEYFLSYMSNGLTFNGPGARK